MLEVVLRLVLALFNLAAMLLLTALPALVLMLRKAQGHPRYVGRLVLMAGVLLILHLAGVAGAVWDMMHPPPGVLVLDPHPYDGWIRLTLNFSIPGALAGLLCAAVAGKGIRRSVSFLSGTLLLALGTAGFVTYAYYFYHELLGLPLSDEVWWLW